MPDLLPMLATAGTHVPVGEDWRHEVKWDGVRTVATVTRGALTLVSRNGNRITDAWPDLTPSTSLRGSVRDVVVDGEIIALNDRGVPDFRMLADRIHARKSAIVARLAEQVPATFMVFDLLRLDGTDLLDRPLAERRDLLSGLDLGAWQVPAAYDDGQMLREATLAQGLEGIVSKRQDSPYLPGVRSPHWLKFAHRHRGSFVIGGWRPQRGASGVDRIAAVLVGKVTADGLAYRGRVGSGIGVRQARVLAGLLEPLTRTTSPFADDVPRVDAEGTTWVEPVLVVDVDTHGLGYQRLRQPSYQGVRSDLTPDDLVPEEA